MTRTIATETYQFSHGHRPRGEGFWVFQDTATGEQVTIEAMYSAAVRQLPAGDWKVMP